MSNSFKNRREGYYLPGVDLESFVDRVWSNHLVATVTRRILELDGIERSIAERFVGPGLRENQQPINETEISISAKKGNQWR